MTAQGPASSGRPLLACLARKPRARIRLTPAQSPLVRGCVGWRPSFALALALQKPPLSPLFAWPSASQAMSIARRTDPPPASYAPR